MIGVGEAAAGGALGAHRDLGGGAQGLDGVGGRGGVGEAEIGAALRRLRLWPMLDGYRGRPRADVAALAAMAVRLGMVMAEDSRLEEIEINPVMLRTEGAVAVDALIRRAE